MQNANNEKIRFCFVKYAHSEEAKENWLAHVFPPHSQSH